MRAFAKLLIGAALGAFQSSGYAKAETFVLGGTGAGLPTITALSAAFAREHSMLSIEIPPSLGSSGAVQAVLGDVVHVGIIARELTPAERVKNVVQIPFAQTPFVVLTSNRLAKNLTRAEIGNIVSGTMIKWADGSQIRIILRSSSDTDTALFKQYFPEFAKAFDATRQRRELPVAATDQDNADLAETMHGSFTFGTYAQIVGERRKLSILSIDGIEPKPATVASKEYPYSKTFYLITKSDPSPVARAFVNFVDSPAGRSILEATGWAPAPKSQQ